MKFSINENLSDHTSNNKIRWYWDRHTQSWIIQALDERGYEIESIYAGNVPDRDGEIEYLKNKYETLDAKKYAPGE